MKDGQSPHTTLDWVPTMPPYRGPEMETLKAQAGTWTLTAPDGRTWQADRPIRCVQLELHERVPAYVALRRIWEGVAETSAAENKARWHVRWVNAFTYGVALALFALFVFVVIGVFNKAHAGPIEFTHRQSPDNWSDWDKHVTVLGIAPAFLIELAAPEWSRPAKFGLCMVPGLAHEFIPGFPTQGNTWSLRDVVSDAVGCGIGLFTFEGRLRVTPSPGGGVRLSYSLTL